MQYVFDFFTWLAHNITKVVDTVSSIFSSIGDMFSIIFDTLSSIPSWLSIPILCMVVLSIVFQVISFIPTESGGH